MKNQSIAVTNTLSNLLADTHVLYVKTQNFHWNVTGPFFYSYHQMFEDQYKKLSDAIDQIAERIRSIRGFAPASLAEFLKLTSLKESSSSKEANSMIEELLCDHEHISKNIDNILEVAKECNDEVTYDLLIERKSEHDKTSWILRSILG